MSKYVKSFLDRAFHISYWPDDNNKLTKGAFINHVDMVHRGRGSLPNVHVTT